MLGTLPCFSFVRLSTNSLAAIIISVTCVMCVVNRDTIPNGFTAALVFSVMQVCQVLFAEAGVMVL